LPFLVVAAVAANDDDEGFRFRGASSSSKEEALSLLSVISMTLLPAGIAAFGFPLPVFPGAEAALVDGWRVMIGTSG
jgi:hypothetical protein